MTFRNSIIPSLAIIGTLCCTPIARTVVTPRIKGVTSHIVCEKSGDDFLVKFALAPAEDGSKCSIRFQDAQPNDFSMATQNGMVSLSWRMSLSEIKAHRNNPYLFNLSVNDKNYHVGIVFDTTRDLVVPCIVQLLIRL